MKEIKIFGKSECARCKSTRNKVEHLIGKENLNVDYRYYDMEDLDDLTEATLLGVFKIPTTVVLVEGEEVKRWEEEIPPSEELLSLLQE
ncbi:MAG: thioredoxin family protein [Caldiserica bacterium]|nr:thioredoxin family protein [Caldisericota bacterium]